MQPRIERRRMQCSRWLLYLAWILFVFYRFGEFRQRRMPWGLFVLPVVLALVGIGVFYDDPSATGKAPCSW